MYRIVRSRTPDESAFYTPERLGRVLRPPFTPERVRSWRSVSLWGSRSAAEHVALDFPRLGDWIAVLRLPDSITLTSFGAPGHWDVQAEPAMLLACVIEVIEVRR